MLDPSCVTGDALRALIRRKINTMLGLANFHRQDREDLEQDLTLSLLKSLPAFQEKCGTPEQFANTVLANAGSNILRDRRAQKRRARAVVSLSEPQSPDVEVDHRLDRAGRESSEHRDLRIDTAEKLAELPTETRKIAEQLKTLNVAQCARRLGLPRSTLKSKLGPKGALFEHLRSLI